MSDQTSEATKIYAAVLAAGESKRFGSSKQLTLFDGEPLVRRAARLARQCCGDRTAIVIGDRAAEVAAAADGECRFMLVNERHAEGIGSSISLAARALGPVADAIVLLLADQPLISSAHVGALLDTWSGDDDEIVISGFDGAQGPPVLLPRGTFHELAKLGGDQGARRLLANKRFSITTVDCACAAADVDTPADLERIAQLAE